MIIADNNYMASRLKIISTLASISVSYSPLATHNQSRGVVYSQDLLRFPEETLLKELADQHEVRVERINKNVDGVKSPTPMLIMTFNRLHLPEAFYAAWYPLKAHQFVPMPRRCIHCQHFCRTSKTCRRQNQGVPGLCICKVPLAGIYYA